MIILQILLLLGPALISVLLYERFRGYGLSFPKQMSLMVVLAFLINMILFAVIWVRGWDYQSELFEGWISLLDVSFLFKYMAISLVTAVVFAYLLSLVKVGKTGIKFVIEKKQEFILVSIILVAMIGLISLGLFSNE